MDQLAFEEQTIKSSIKPVLGVVAEKPEKESFFGPNAQEYLNIQK